jgi:hypothetical protein
MMMKMMHSSSSTGQISASCKSFVAQIVALNP